MELKIIISKLKKTNGQLTNRVQEQSRVTSWTTHTIHSQLKEWPTNQIWSIRTFARKNYDPDKELNEKKSISTALATTNYPRFKGRCFTYRNFSHKSADYPNKKNDSENDSYKKKKI